MILFGEDRMVMVTVTATATAMATVTAMVMVQILKRKAGKKDYLRKNKLLAIAASKGFKSFIFTFLLKALI